jgi:DNA-binding transcriptional LysR family regulator
MKPTEEARLFYRDVERSYLGLRELSTAAKEIRGFGRSRFSFGATPGVALEFVPSVIAAFNQEYGPVQIATHVSTTDRILDDTRSGRVSLAIITPNESTADVETILERKLYYVAIMHHGHPLAKSTKPLDIHTVKTGELISPPASFLVPRCDKPEIAAAIDERTKITIDVSFTAAAMARQALGVALVDPLTAAFFARDPLLVTRQLIDAPCYPFTLIQPRRLIASELQIAFIDAIKRQLEIFMAG